MSALNNLSGVDEQAQQNWARSQTVTPDLDKSLYHYLFLPIDLSGGMVDGGGLDISHSVMTSGLTIIRRGRFQLVKDKAWVNPRAPLGGDGAEVGDDEREIGQPFTVGKRTEIAHAQDIAYMLTSGTYRDSGFVVVGALTGIPEAVARWVELVLLPAKVGGVVELHRHLEEFDIVEMPEFPDSPQWQGWRLSTGILPSALVSQVRRELLTACATGENFMRTFYSDQRSEMQQAMVPGGKGGLSRITEKLRLFIKELGLEPLDGLAATAERSRAAFEAAAMPTTLQLPAELTDMFKLLLAQGFQITPPAAAASAPVPATENWASASETQAPQAAEPGGPEEETPTTKLDPAVAGETKTVEQKSKDETPFAGVAKCGAPKADGSGTCSQSAGRGTDHPGTGHCNVHGG